MSTTEATYEDDDYIPMTPALQIPAAVGLALLMIIAIGGNVMTLIAYTIDKKLHSVYNFYIFNLALADLLIASISMPFYCVYTLTEFTWIFGTVFCKIWLTVDFTVCLATILIMLILSVDRLLLIYLGPLYTSRITKKVALIQIAVSWLSSFLLYGPAIIGWDFWTGFTTVEHMDCDVEFAYNFDFTTTTAIVEFIIPFCFMTIVNVLIYYKIRSRSKINPRVQNPTTERQTGINSLTNIDNAVASTSITIFSSLASANKVNFGNPVARTSLTIHPSTVRVHETNSGTPVAGTSQFLHPATTRTHEASIANAGQNSTKPRNSSYVAISQAVENRKAAKILAALVLVFLICWSPYIVTTIIISYCETCVNKSLYEAFNWVLWIKSAINPLLYAYNSIKYRNHFKRFLTLSCLKKTTYINNTSSSTSKRRTSSLTP